MRANDYFSFLLKTNGTLWSLASPQRAVKKNWQAFIPRRLGTDFDWAAISALAPHIPILQKRDGRAWIFNPDRVNTIPVLGWADALGLEADSNLYLDRAPLLDQSQWRSVAAVYTPSSWSGSVRRGYRRVGSVAGVYPPRIHVGVRKDGTFRVLTAWQPPAGTFAIEERVDAGWMEEPVDVQLGQASDWRGLSGNGKVVVTLKTDGSLWKWDFPDDPVTNPRSARAERLSRHSDWLAIAPVMGGIVSLAADGSLWFWQFQPRDHTLLAASARPQRIGNVFGATGVSPLPIH